MVNKATGKTGRVERPSGEERSGQFTAYARGGRARPLPLAFSRRPSSNQFSRRPLAVETQEDSTAESSCPVTETEAGAGDPDSDVGTNRPERVAVTRYVSGRVGVMVASRSRKPIGTDRADSSCPRDPAIGTNPLHVMNAAVPGKTISAHQAMPGAGRLRRPHHCHRNRQESRCHQSSPHGLAPSRLHSGGFAQPTRSPGDQSTAGRHPLKAATMPKLHQFPSR